MPVWPGFRLVGAMLIDKHERVGGWRPPLPRSGLHGQALGIRRLGVPPPSSRAANRHRGPAQSPTTQRGAASHIGWAETALMPARLCGAPDASGVRRPDLSRRVRLWSRGVNNRRLSRRRDSLGNVSC